MKPRRGCSINYTARRKRNGKIRCTKKNRTKSRRRRSRKKASRDTRLRKDFYRVPDPPRGIISNYWVRTHCPCRDPANRDDCIPCPHHLKQFKDGRKKIP